MGQVSVACTDLLHCKSFPLCLKVVVFQSQRRQPILFGSEARFLNECKIIMLRKAGRFMVRKWCEVQLRDRKRSMDLMLMLGFIETMDELAQANSVCWYGHVLRRRNGHFLRRALEIEVDGQSKKLKPKKT